MATRYIDPAILTPAAVAGHATIFPDVITALIVANNLTVGTDASWTPGAISTAGAVPLSRFVIATIDGTTAYTLADGTYPGQTVTIFCVAGTNIPAGTVTPATRSGYAAVGGLGALGDLVTFLWTGAAWVIVAANGVTFS